MALATGDDSCAGDSWSARGSFWAYGDFSRRFDECQTWSIAWFRRQVKISGFFVFVIQFSGLDPSLMSLKWTPNSWRWAVGTDVSNLLAAMAEDVTPVPADSRHIAWIGYISDIIPFL